MRRDVEADLEPRSHRRLELVRPLADDPRVDRGGLGAGDDVRHVDDGPRVGDAGGHDLGAEPLEDPRRGTDRRVHRAVEPVEEIILGKPDAEAVDGCVEQPLVVGHAPPARRRVVRVVAGNHAEHERRVRHGAREGPDVVERPRQRHHARPTHAPVRRLEPDDAAAGRGQPDRASRVAAERPEDEPRGDRGRRAARRAARDVTRPPRVLDVTVVGVVPEGPERELRHVELAERHGAAVAQAAHGGALVLGRKVLARDRAARGRQPADVAEVLVGERNAVERPAREAGGQLGLELSRRREGALRVDRDEAPDLAVEPRDALQALARHLDG